MRYRRSYRRRKLTPAQRAIQTQMDVQSFRSTVIATGVAKELTHVWDEPELDRIIAMIESDLRPALREYDRLDKLLPGRQRAVRRNPTTNQETVQ